MKEFGWTIEYTLALTFPQFFDLFGLIKRIRYDAAIDEFYTPYAAAKFGGKCSKHLSDGRSSIILDASDASKSRDYTPAMVRRANHKLKALIKIPPTCAGKNSGTKIKLLALIFFRAIFVIAFLPQ